MISPEWAAMTAKFSQGNRRAPQNVGEGLTYVGEKIHDAMWTRYMMEQGHARAGAEKSALDLAYGGGPRPGGGMAGGSAIPPPNQAPSAPQPVPFTAEAQPIYSSNPDTRPALAGGGMAAPHTEATSPAKTMMSAPPPVAAGGMADPAQESTAAPTTKAAPSDPHVANLQDRIDRINSGLAALPPGSPHQPRMLADLQRHQDKMDALTDPLAKAKLENLNAQTQMIRSRSDLYSAKADGVGGNPAPRIAMREDGTTYDVDETPRVSSQVLGTSTAAPDTITVDEDGKPIYPPADDPGSKMAATAATDVPGLVITPKGVPSAYGTQRNDQRIAMSKLQQADLERMQAFQDTQRRWTSVHGKAPSGMKYNEDGSLHSLKKDEEETRALSKTAALTDDVKNARSVLVDGSNVGSRGLAAASGGWLFPAKEEAMRSVDHAVTQFTAMVEGKRHANAQDVRMLRFFSPQWHDSSEIIGFKLDQLHRIMNGYLGNKVPSGSVFKTELQKSVEMAKSKGIKVGAAPPPGPAGPGMAGTPASSLKGLSNEDLIRRLKPNG